MNTETKNRSGIDLENVITVALDDLPEDDRRELERELEEEQVQMLKLKLTGYQKTRNRVIKKVSSSPSDAFNTEVQSAINEGRLTFTEGSKMKLNSDLFLSIWSSLRIRKWLFGRIRPSPQEK
jgi:hypothetical protein